MDDNGGLSMQNHRHNYTQLISEVRSKTNPATKARGRHPGFRLDASLMYTGWWFQPL